MWQVFYWHIIPKETQKEFTLGKNPYEFKQCAGRVLYSHWGKTKLILILNDTWGIIKELTLRKNRLNVNNVASALAKQKTWGNKNEFTLERSLLNVNSVASVLSKFKVIVKELNWGTAFNRNEKFLASVLQKAENLEDMKECILQKGHVNSLTVL